MTKIHFKIAFATHKNILHSIYRSILKIIILYAKIKYVLKQKAVFVRLINMQFERGLSI